MRVRFLALIGIGLFISTVASAAPHPGKVAFEKARGFARDHNLPHFVVDNRGNKVRATSWQAGRRIIVNVPNNKMEDWVQTFSARKKFVEPFFGTTPGGRKPFWSMLRINKRTWEEYGRGEDHDMVTSSGRMLFPLYLPGRGEMRHTVKNIIKRDYGNRQVDTTDRWGNRPWDEYSGYNSSRGQNCTNWLTEVIGRYTGVETNSVLGHAGAMLEQGYHADRMSVMAIQSRSEIADFGADQLERAW